MKTRRVLSCFLSSGVGCQAQGWILSLFRVLFGRPIRGPDALVLARSYFNESALVRLWSKIDEDG
jgi:hypothetical protein